MTITELRNVVKVLGVKGATAGIIESDLSDTEILGVAKRLKISPEMSKNRAMVVDQIVSHVSSSSLKPVDDLLKMTFEELEKHFNTISVPNSELMKVMTELDFRVRSEDKKHLRRYAARQISETALFSNVAEKGRL